MNTETFSKATDSGYNSKLKPDQMSEAAIKDTVHDVGRKVGDKASEIANQTAGRYQQSRIYVKKHPTTGVIAAAAAGMALGSVLTAALRKNA